MTSTLSCQFLSETSLLELLTTYNAAFLDYSVPMQWTQEQLEDKLLSDGVVLDCSIGVYDGTKLVAFVLNAVDGTNCYNSATGVLPEYRSKGLTSLMLEMAVAHLKEMGCKNYYLEVLETNAVAQIAYANNGFEKTRAVSSFKGIVPLVAKKLDLCFTDLPYYEYLIYYAQKDIAPTWQNNDFSIANIENQVCIKRLVFKQQFAGYVVYHPEKRKVLQLWVTPALRRQGIGSQVLQSLFDRNATLTLTNVDLQTEGIRLFLEKNGLNVYVKQFEMKRVL